MKWFVAAPFISGASDQWLTAFVPEVAGRTFTSVPARYHHDRSRRSTGLAEWSDYFAHGAAVWRAAGEAGAPSGILTCFPQLPIVVGLSIALEVDPRLVMLPTTPNQRAMEQRPRCRPFENAEWCCRQPFRHRTVVGLEPGDQCHDGQRGW